MKRFLVHTIILLGLLAPALFAQSDSSVQAGSALGSLEEELRKPSQSELYRRARVALVESIKKRDFQRAGEALDYLKEKVMDGAPLTISEEVFIDMEIGRYADGVDVFIDEMRVLFDTTYSQTKDEGEELDDALNDYLSKKYANISRVRSDSLISVVEKSDIDDERKELYAALMYVGLAINMDFQILPGKRFYVTYDIRDTACARVLKERAKKFVSRYPYSQHTRYLNEMLIPEIGTTLEKVVLNMKDPWSYKYYTGGLGVFVGKWAGFIAGTDVLESSMKFSFSLEASLQIWRISVNFLYTSGLLTYAKYMGKGEYPDETADEAYGLNFGYTLYDSRFLKVEPFLGFGTYDFLAIDDQWNWRCGECSSNVVSLGANVDLRLFASRPSEVLGSSVAFIVRLKYMAQFGNFYDDCSDSEKTYDEGFIVNTFGLSLGLYLW